MVRNDPDSIRSAWRRMLCEVPEKYTRWIEAHPENGPEKYQGLTGEELKEAIATDIAGVLMVQFMPPDSSAFGNELIVGLRNTREFGMVLSAGLGGTDTELYAEYFRKNRAIVSAATAGMDGLSFFELFSKTVSYKKLMGQTRGQSPIVTDAQLVECFSALIEVGNHFSPANPKAPFLIEEFEINPFAFTDFRMVPLDGLLKFTTPGKPSTPRPIKKIDALLHPESIGIIGVSPSRMNFGRIILKNMLGEGFDPKKVTVFHPTAESIDGVRCISGLDKIEQPLDLFVVAVGAHMVPDLIDSVIAGNTANSILLIPGGLGETEESKEQAEAIIANLNEAHAQGDGGPIILGANSMGVVSHPGHYDTWFLPENKLPKLRSKKKRNIAFISQSGAFMGTRMSQCLALDPAYLISLGNQTDLTLRDFMVYFRDSEKIDVIGVYTEGFNDLDGAMFTEAVRDAVQSGKDVVFYKAGRTPEGQLATSGHTASLAGDYTVCESCMIQAGAMVAQTIDQFIDLLKLASALHGLPVNGKRIGGFSSAGFEAVGIADYIQSDDFSMSLADFSPATRARLLECIQQKKLDKLVPIKNPLDVNPGADDEVFASVIQAMNDDDNIDAVVACLNPLPPTLHSLAGEDETYRQGILAMLAGMKKGLDTPVVLNVDGGQLFDNFPADLETLGYPVFRSVDRAINGLSLYMETAIKNRGKH